MFPLNFVCLKLLSNCVDLPSCYCGHVHCGHVGMDGYRDQEDAAIHRPRAWRFTPTKEFIVRLHPNQVCCQFTFLFAINNKFFDLFSNFVVWISAFWNHHYMVALATLIALLALVFQPLGGAMFTVRDTWFTHSRKFSHDL